ncbi:ABC transporter ATP-binding protein [Trujillonella endophytica]|uniref:Peptide/nickel transport system ATP-binding protein n=1 Tax=Trujillonella endophytica TaxID=673521 RepID=A0A1H8UXY0_9ACTN|nr:ABC transporter ATP-binding protein [Trujillella endophytica]SEP07428.1 peptide/nickel transport system ATP-binding protein [Trujillella endophytica]
MTGAPPLLQIEDLHTWIATDAGPVRAVDGVSLEVAAGEAVGLVGESGSGKSMLARTVMGLLPDRASTSGSVLFAGVDMLTVSEKARQALLGPKVAMVFQDAGRALNPVVRIGRQITEGMVRHLGISRSEAQERAVGLLTEVGVPDPRRRLSNYPFQLSGGMRQRIMIAIALACEPDLLIADEPTTALDVTVQRQILDLLDRVRTSRGMGLVLISHDLGLVAGRTDRVAVMYSGRMVEEGPTDAVFDTPRHRYTEALLASTPSLDTPRARRMRVIEGSLPDPRRPPPGCRFAPRCTARTEACDESGVDVLRDGVLGHRHACVHPTGTPGATALTKAVAADETRI